MSEFEKHNAGEISKLYDILIALSDRVERLETHAESVDGIIQEAINVMKKMGVMPTKEPPPWT